MQHALRAFGSAGKLVRNALLILLVGLTMALSSLAYANGIVVTAIEPNHGRSDYGRQSVVRGTGLLSVTGVLVDGAHASFQRIADDELWVTFQAHAVGAVDLSLTNASGTLVIQDAYTYLEPPILTGITFPSAGTYSAGDTISITYTYDKAVVVDSADKVAYHIGNPGNPVRYPTEYVNYQAGSGTNSLTYSGVLRRAQADEICDGLYQAGSLRPAAKLAAGPTIDPLEDSFGHLYAGDDVKMVVCAPKLQSIVNTKVPTQSDKTAVFTVTYDQEVTNLASKASLNRNGTVTGSIASVVHEGNAVYTITTGTLANSGTVSLTIAKDVRNAAGLGTTTASFGTSFTVTDVPAAPMGVSADVTSIHEVRFTAPASNGSEITGYEVADAAETVYGTGTASPITLTGLTYGQSYQFKVRAQNALGWGPWSSLSSAVTPMGTQTVTFEPPTSLALTQTATLSASSSVTTTFSYLSSTTSVCTVSGNVVTPKAVGSCTVRVTAAATATHSVAYVLKTITITATPSKLSQTISFTPPSEVLFGANFDLATYASASSGLAVSFTSSTTGVCTVSSVGVVTPVALGTCTISVSQAGNDDYDAATSVQKSFTIAAQVLTISSVAPSVPTATIGATYSAEFSVGSYSGTVAWSVSSGALPTGLSLDASNGTISGTVSAAAGTYGFTLRAYDNTTKAEGTQSFSISVVLPTTPTAQDKQQTVPAGSTPLPVDLVAGATGGPFTGATIVDVTPPHAGTARITNGEVAQAGGPTPVGYYLAFKPNPYFSGQVVIRYTLSSGTGTSNIASVTLKLSINMDAQAEKLRGTINDFVTRRSDLIASGIHTPSLRDRRSLNSATAPGQLTARPNGNSITLGYASSTAEWAAFDAMDSAMARPRESDMFNFWTDGSATLHLRSGETAEKWGGFAIMAMGADALISNGLLSGVSLHFDWMDERGGEATTRGQGFVVGPYVSVEFTKGLYFDASVQYGRSWNKVTGPVVDGHFGTERWLGQMSLEGDVTLAEDISLRPMVQLHYLRETVGSYRIEDGVGFSTVVDDYIIEQLRASVGGRLHYLLDFDAMQVASFVGLQYGFGLTNGQWSHSAQVSAGADFSDGGPWTLGLTSTGELSSSGFRSVSARARLGVRF
jgi:hypothetical protein